MTSSFMDYAMSVIVSRALPDARDGLKPVHRRILFAQRGLNNTFNRPYLKCARIVGDVIGKYHPHGDSAVYDALVRMAQDFSMRYMLIDGQGNFGSVDGDPPAAMRYTECRMSKLAGELLADIDKETVDWQPNYDDKELEPTVLPTKVPNLLINGSSGIAVGMATNIPPHNLGEIIDGVLALIADPRLPDDELVKLIPGPDFPTGGVIQGRVGILSAHQHRPRHRGRARRRPQRGDPQGPHGDHRQRAAVHGQQVALDRGDRRAGPRQEARGHQRHPRRVRPHRHAGRDRAQARRRRQGRAQQPVQAHRSCRPRSAINMLAIVEGKPVLLSLRRALQVFIDHRRDVVTRRTLFDLREARARREIVEGLGLAVINIDRVIEIIRSSKDTDEAKARLIAEPMSGLGRVPRARRPPRRRGRGGQRARHSSTLTARQAQAILDMRLGRLTGLEREKLEAEYKELWQLTDYLEGLLADEAKLMAAIIDELRQIKTEFADPRRTRDRRRRGRDPHRGADRPGGHGRHPHPPRLHQAHAGRRVRGPGPRRPRHHRRDARPRATSSSTCSRRRPTTTCCCSPTRAAPTTRRCSSCPRARGTVQGPRDRQRARPPGGRAGGRDAAVQRVPRRHLRVLRDPVRHGQEDRAVAVRERPRRAGSRRSRSRTATA